MTFRFTLAASALALLAAHPALAAQTADADAIVVTATRFSENDVNAAANVSVITRQDIRNSPAQSLPDLLGSRAGIFVSQLGGGIMGRNATIDMRGFGSTASSNTLILVDGLRVNPIDMGSIIWSSIPLDSVERIEIVRGSGTVLYGDGATGGVINIITDKSGKRAFDASATAGSHGYRGADVRLANGNDRAYFNVAGNFAASDGYRRNAQEDQKSLNGRAGLILDRGELFADFAVYEESQGLPGSIFSRAYANDPRSTRFPHDTEQRDGYRIRPGVSYQINADLRFEAEVGVEHQTLKSNFISSNTASDRDRDTVSLTPRLRWRHGLGAFGSETVVGADLYDGKVDSENRGYANQSAEQKSSAFYLQNVTQLIDPLSLTLGYREQRVKQSAEQDAYAPWFSPAFSGDSTRARSAYDVGLAYAADGWRIYGKTGTTFRFPNVDELFGYDQALMVPVFAGDLRPQHGRTSEIGGSLKAGPAQLRVSLYRLTLTDEIGYDGAIGANTNFDPTRRQGAEVEAKMQLSAAWQALISYAYTDAEFRDGPYAGKEVPLVPRHQATAQLNWDTGASGRYAALVRHVGERRYGSDFTNTQGMLSGYTTLDLQAVWSFAPWTVSAKVLNATDRKYSPFAGYSAFYNDTYYYPADGRSFLATARYNF